MITLNAFDKFENVEHFYREYESEVLVNSCDVDCLKWAVENFYRKDPLYKEEIYYVGHKDNELVGIMGIIKFGEPFPIGVDFPSYVPMIKVEHFIEFITQMKEPLNINDVSMLYVKNDIEKYAYKTKANIINLFGYKNLEEYITALPDNSTKKDFRYILRKNSQIEVSTKFDNENEIQALISQYKDYWNTIKGTNIDSKIDLDLKLCDSSSTKERTHTLYFTHKEKLVAINKCRIYDNYLADVICIWDREYKKQEIGKFAVLKNIESVLGEVGYYDLSTDPFSNSAAYKYKKSFINAHNINAHFYSLSEIKPPFYCLHNKQWILDA